MPPRNFVFTRKALPPNLAHYKDKDIYQLSDLSSALVQSFEHMSLHPSLLQSIYAKGYEKPAVCQEHVIMPFIQGRDIICQAESGLGKTGAFCIGLLQQLSKDLTGVNKGLVIAPTRELAEQIAAEFNELGRGLGVRTVICVGGTRVNLEILANAKIYVGTVGRIWDLVFRRAFININHIKHLVIDEFDRMIMDRTIFPHLNMIISGIPAETQVALFSATVPSPALKKTETFLRHPFKFLRPNDQLQLIGIRQYKFSCSEVTKDKIEDLVNVINLLTKSSGYGIVFCNTRNRAYSVYKMICEKEPGFKLSSSCMVGTNFNRDSTLRSLKLGIFKLLIASDLIGRGIDVQQVKWVVNFDLPDSVEEYIHRIGRAGRYGRKGIAISFVAQHQSGKIESIEKFYSSKIPEIQRKDFTDIKTNLE